MSKRTFSQTDMQSQPEEIKHNIELTEQERQIFDTVREVLQHHNLSTVVRAAGGWVRDKLLGRHSTDIDLAVDNMKGTELAQMISDYLHEVKGIETSSIGVIKKNPEQSKHLETATFFMFGLSIDMNSLRSETYADSRIPITTIGTPEQDAYRRDFTMNALYYNLNTGQVEDFVQTGLEDLQRGFLRTPLDPLQTFLDDPLRVLRAIRFACRFGFEVDPAIARAASDPQVCKSFTKVSRERYGIELGKMLVASRASSALQMIVDYGLYSTVFALPPNIDQKDVPPAEELARAGLVAAHRTQTFLDENDEVRQFSKDQRRDLVLAAFLHPLARLTHKVKNKISPVPFYVITNSIKLKNEIGNDVCLFLELGQQFSSQLVSVAAAAEGSEGKQDESLLGVGPEAIVHRYGAWASNSSRLLLGSLLRRAREKWPFVLDMGFILANQDERLRPFYLQARQFIEHDSHLDQCWTWSPFLRGDDLMKKFKVQGSMISDLINKQVEWRLVHEWRFHTEQADADQLRQECSDYVETLINQRR